MVATYIFWLVILTVLITLRVFGGRPAFVTLLEYQRAVLYRDGLPIREVGTGRHLVYTGIEKIMILDTRPIQVSYENRCVALRDGLSAVYGFSGAARVRDARKAVYSAADYNQVPPYILLCSARLVLNGWTSAQLRANKDGLVNEIVSRAKPRLEAAGFELLSFNMPQCTVTAELVD